MKEFVISEAKVETAVLVGLVTQTQDERKTNEYLDELAFLAETAGAEVVKRFTQKLPAANSVTYVVKGKLEEIRHRANPANTKIAATLDLISKERRKELVLEGHRLYDILRQGVEITRQGDTHFLNGNDLITVDWSDYRTVMPIPQAEIDANPNMKQNPEY